MSNAAAPTRNIVHESIDERQHVRAVVPAKITLTAGNADSITCDVSDISVGGIGFVYPGTLAKDALLDAVITLRIQGAELNIRNRLRVITQQGQHVGAEFVEIEREKVDILRHLITAYMAGDIIDIGGLINLVQRDGYVQRRKNHQPRERTASERIKSAAGSLLFVLVGLLALIFVIRQSYLLIFRVPATSAEVTGRTYVLNMPESGQLSYLIGASRSDVRAGEPLANISTQLASHPSATAGLAQLPALSAEDARLLHAPASVETLVNSPCDCEIHYPIGRLDGFYFRQTPVIELISKNEPLFVQASVPYSELNDLNRVRSVRLTVFGQNQTVNGTIRKATLNEQNQQLLLEIAPEKPLPRSAYRRPVAVEFLLGWSL